MKVLKLRTFDKKKKDNNSKMGIGIYLQIAG